MADTRSKPATLVTLMIGRDIVVVIDYQRGSVRVNVPEGVEVTVDPPARETRVIGPIQRSTRIN